MPTENLGLLSCPTPHSPRTTVQMAHGGGGRWMQWLLDQVFLPALGNPILEQRHDSAVLALPQANGSRLAFTTDSYVVKPLFFPGGDIGSLAVHGTVNDLAMSGSRPLWLSAAFILEEGLPLETLARICASMQRAAASVGVAIVTGDTKVVERGKGDGLYINTTGLGVLEHRQELGPRQVQPGDAILLSGDIGRHGMAIMAAREGIHLETTLESDSADLSGLVRKLCAADVTVHCLRDLTRGGLASALVEIAEVSATSMEISEAAIPLIREVRAACEVLGFDPLHVACEGRMVAFVPQNQAEHALAVLRSDPLGKDARCVGAVAAGSAGLVTMRNQLGTQRVVDRLSGDQLPRIC